jgi:hypothetical protein
VFGKASIAIAASDVALANALATVHVATLVLVSAHRVTAALLATIRVILGEIPVTRKTLVASATRDVTFTMTLAGLGAGQSAAV